MPFRRAASKIVVPAGTETAGRRWSTGSSRGVELMLSLASRSRHLRGNDDSAMCSSTTSREMLQHRRDGNGNDLSEAADRGELHRARIARRATGDRAAQTAFGPASQHLDHLLRSEAAGNTLAAGFVAVEAHRVQRHVEHAAAFGADHDRARTDHGARRRHGIPVEWKVDHRGGQIARRRTRRRECEQLTLSQRRRRRARKISSE